MCTRPCVFADNLFEAFRVALQLLADNLNFSLNLSFFIHALAAVYMNPVCRDET